MQDNSRKRKWDVVPTDPVELARKRAEMILGQSVFPAGAPTGYEQEVPINDCPAETRFYLCRGATHDEIATHTQATIKVRGRYVAPGERPPIGEKPLHLFVTASTKIGLDAAVSRIQEVIRRDQNKQMRPQASDFITKVVVGMEGYDPSFPLLEKLNGPGGSFLKHIETTARAKQVVLKGYGSGFLEGPEQRETREPLHVFVLATSKPAMEQARNLAESLVTHVRQAYAAHMQARGNPPPQHYGPPPGYPGPHAPIPYPPGAYPHGAPSPYMPGMPLSYPPPYPPPAPGAAPYNPYAQPPYPPGHLPPPGTAAPPSAGASGFAYVYPESDAIVPGEKKGPRRFQERPADEDAEGTPGPKLPSQADKYNPYEEPETAEDARKTVSRDSESSESLSPDRLDPSTSLQKPVARPPREVHVTLPRSILKKAPTPAPAEQGIASASGAPLVPYAEEEEVDKEKATELKPKVDSESPKQPPKPFWALRRDLEDANPLKKREEELNQMHAELMKELGL